MALWLAAASLPWAALAPAKAATLAVGKAAQSADAILTVDVGNRRGIFAKHGLDLRIVDFTSGGKMVQAMAAGSIDIGVGAGIQMALIAKGAPILAVCESAATLPYFSIGVPWDSPIRTKEDLKGKRIGVSGAGSLTEWLGRELARSEGWGPDGVILVAIGSGGASTAAFREHLIDAYIGGTTTFLAMEEQHAGRVLVPVSDYVGRIASGTIFAVNRLIASDPGAIRAFLEAWLETEAFIRGHKDETVSVWSAVTGFSPAVMAKEYDIVRGMFDADCRFDGESLATLRRSFVELKLLDAPPDMAKLYTERFVPGAAPR